MWMRLNKFPFLLKLILKLDIFRDIFISLAKELFCIGESVLTRSSLSFIPNSLCHKPRIVLVIARYYHQLTPPTPCSPNVHFSCGGNCYAINVTSWFGPIELVQPTYGYILPQLIFITLIFNSLIILVLTRFELITCY